MANFEKYFPIEVNEEGAVYENVPGDNGGCTKYGLTLDDFHEYTGNDSLTCESVKAIDRQTAHDMLKKLYWDFFSADHIEDQELAMFIVDGGLNMGRVLIAKYVQTILGLTSDGKPGPKTLAGINAVNSADLFKRLYDRRKQRYDAIVANNPSQAKFIKGWINRLNMIQDA